MNKIRICSFVLFMVLLSCMQETGTEEEKDNQNQICQEKSGIMEDKTASSSGDSVVIPDSVSGSVQPVKKNDSVFVEKELEEEPEEIFIIVEDLPRFVNRDWKDFRKYVSHQLNYPLIALENGISGEVLVQFTVDETGNVKDVFILRGVDPGLDREAFRVVCLSPKWIPGKQRGKPVSTKMIIPVKFVLQ